MGRRRSRSTQTPAGSANRMNGMKPSTPRSENSNGETCRSTAASQGIASAEIWVPNSLTDCPVHSFMKSAWLQRPAVGRRGLRTLGPFVERGGEAVRPAGRGVGGAEVVDQPLEPAGEPARVVVAKPGAHEGEGRPAVLGEGKHLLGCAAEGGRGEVPDVLALCIGALEDEQARDAA